MHTSSGLQPACEVMMGKHVSQQTTHQPRLPLGGIITMLALLLYAGVPLLAGFDGFFGQDPFGYYDYAVQILESARAARLPPPYYWPIGYPALVAASFALAGAAPLVAQAVSILAGVGIVRLVYALAWELAVQSRAEMPLPSRNGGEWRSHHGHRMNPVSDTPKRAEARWTRSNALQRVLHSSSGLKPACCAEARFVAATSALLALGCGQLWLWSVSIMADTTALFWATLAAWALARYGRAMQLRWLALAAVALAAALMSRWLYGLLVVPFGLYWLVALSGAANRKARVLHAAVAVALGLLALSPQIAVSAAAPQALLGHQWLTGWSPLNALRRSFETPDGVASYPLPVALFYAKAAASPRFLVPLFTPFLLLGAAALAWQRGRMAALLLGWGALMYLFLSGIPYQNFRFTLALLPPIAITAAYGLMLVWRRAAPTWRTLMLAGLALGLAASIVYNAGVLREQFARKRSDVAVARWVEAQLGPGDRLLAFELTLTLQHYTPLDVRELFDLTQDEVQAFAADERPTFLLVDVADLTGQWSNLAPDRNYRWLRDTPGLVPLGEQQQYSLFRVEKP
ncbi:MAG: hypothetical protein H7Y32_10410 [Chloroflexales bacterium]|nr:hypothetical protein [Chloroflexales bacterium]